MCFKPTTHFLTHTDYYWRKINPTKITFGAER